MILQEKEISKEEHQVETIIDMEITLDGLIHLVLKTLILNLINKIVIGLANNGMND